MLYALQLVILDFKINQTLIYLCVKDVLMVAKLVHLKILVLYVTQVLIKIWMLF